MTQYVELAGALFEAFEKRDDDTVRSLCSPTMQAFQNLNPPMDIEALLAMNKAVQQIVKDFRYANIRRSATGSGFVEEHNVRGSLPDGSQLVIAACVVAEVKDGQIHLIREYLDTAAAAGLIKYLADAA